MVQRWKSLSFIAKLIIVYVVSIASVVVLITYTQIDLFVSLSKKTRTENLKMITEQIALNFSENQDTITETIYSHATTFLVPSLMYEYNATGGANHVELQYALNQMVSNSTDYNFVILEMPDGRRFDTGYKHLFGGGEINKIRIDCQKFSEEYGDNTYGNNVWYREKQGDIYVLKDVYDTNPLRYVGRMLVHMKTETFTLSASYSSDLTFLFFDKSQNYLTVAGVQLPDDMIGHIQDAVKDGAVPEMLKWDGEEYELEQKMNDGWTAVGISCVKKYRQAERQVMVSGIIYGVISLCIGTMIVFILLHSLMRNLKRLRKSMYEVAKGDLDYQMVVKGEDDIGQLAGAFNYMTNKISALLEELLKKEREQKNIEIEILEYKYRALETQIRPHFIYNAMESINALAKMKKTAEIEEAVQRISRYFRNIAVNTTRQFITMEQEFESLRDYTEIYGFIHGNKLQVTYAAREEAKNAIIPTMIMQPVVENALKYGLRSTNDISEIRVHAYKKEEKLYITVKDNGAGLSKETEVKILENQELPVSKTSGIGISNVKERLHLIYGNEAGFDIRNRPEGGVVVKISIPFSYSEPEIGESDVLEELEEIDN